MRSSPRSEIRAIPWPRSRRPSSTPGANPSSTCTTVARCPPRLSAQVAGRYALDDLPGRQVAAVVNFPPKQIGKFMSEILVLGFPGDDGEVVLIGPDRKVPDGGRLY